MYGDITYKVIRDALYRHLIELKVLSELRQENGYLIDSPNRGNQIGAATAKIVDA